jgi:tripartite-type tricarboxylate transporter receptor subunit TctC
MRRREFITLLGYAAARPTGRETGMMIAGHGWKRVANTLLMITLPLAAAIGAPLMAGSVAIAQTYPSQLIKVICPISSGSPIDVTARLVTNDLSNRLGKPVIVENRPGGGGTIGVGEFTRAAPDGHTLLCGAIGDAFASKVVGRDPAKDFIPVATVARINWVLVVRPGLPANSVGQLIEHAKANPGKLNWGFGQGTAPHMFGEMFKAATGIVVTNIPYKSGAQAVPDMLGGRIDINFGTLSNLLPLIREGKVRAIAVTSEARSPDLPDVPTMAQSGFPQLTRGDWIGFWAPAGTSADIVNRLNREINAGLTTAETKAAMKKLGFEPSVGSPQEFAAFIRNEMEAWTPAAKAADILPK